MKPNKIGRNKPCWCGSGIKYKKCHIDREEQKPVEHWEAAKEFKNKFSVQVCSAPTAFHGECSKKIIKAHTIPKSSSLKAIAKDGHVYGFNFSLENLRKYHGKIRPELIGINRASTFNGFCETHDDKIFAPLEKKDFTSSQEQCFLLTYRAFSRECYTKSAMANLQPLRSSLDRGKPIERQMDIQEKSFRMDFGASVGLRDNEFHKQKFDESLKKQDFSNCQAVIFTMNAPPPVMVSGATNPDFDFNGNLIQDMGDFETTPDLMAINSFCDKEKGYIVISWLAHSSEAPIKLVQSLLKKNKDDYSKLLIQYLFNGFENYFMSPFWWDEVSKLDKEKLMDLMDDMSSFMLEPNANGISSVQLDIDFPAIKNISFVNWKPENQL